MILQKIFGEFREAFTKSPMERHAPKCGSTLPLLPMLEDLQTLTSEQWGLYAFGREPIRDRLSEEEKRTLIRQAQECGRQEAEALLLNTSGLLPTELAEKLGLKLAYPDMPNGGGNVIFAQFEEPDKITVFMDTVNKAAAMLAENEDLRMLLGAVAVRELLVAHELFHVVEMQKKDTIFTRNLRIPLWKVGKFQYTSSVGCLSEIAGMEFAASLLGMSFSPYVYDVFFIYLYNSAVSSDLYRSICRLAGHESIEYYIPSEI